VNEKTLANPAVVGLAGFGGTTLLLQFHNFGWCGASPVLWTALFFGGLMQLMAGMKEFQTGNNFGFAAFSTYGAFWMALGGILLGTNFGILQPTTADLGWFLVMFTVITGVFLVGAVRISIAHGLLFLTLFLGFIFLDISHLAGPAMSFFTIVAAVDLTICGLTAWYIMAHIALEALNVAIPLGKPLVGLRTRPAEIEKAPVST
jgi:succinate-acetate transporter protein